ncbi:MAG TPA: hypothetical protein VK509_12985 [Polyangiales bacterium]|nr:hypothetical protein [Polyangiales bacterium]
MSAREPRRLREIAAGRDPALAVGLDAFGAQHGNAAEIQRLERRLARELLAPRLAGSSTGSAPHSVLWSKAVLGALAALALVVTVAWLARTPQPRRQPAQKPPALSAEVQPSRLQQLDPNATLPIAVPAAREPDSERPSARARPLRNAPAKAPHTRARSPQPERELELLRRAQSALARDPRAALALSEEHARVHRDGVFAQEREVLAIEALLKLRQSTAARARAERFITRFPQSPHARRVRALLARTQPTPVTVTNAAAAGDSSAHPNPEKSR